MSVPELLLLLVIAGACGSIARAIVGVSRGGCLVSIVLGFIGALLGSWLSEKAGLPELLNIQVGNKAFPVLWSIIGAALFIALLTLISGRRRS
ncbi:MAG: GlsB/YeaQ/YmgE family stress response membrane protein [Planctomycetaceae bacterium]|nr:GlsB/YeaQ/YmgE family stress response membrane protein [Planctomycetaceae bacterium]